MNSLIACLLAVLVLSAGAETPPASGQAPSGHALGGIPDRKAQEAETAQRRNLEIANAVKRAQERQEAKYAAARKALRLDGDPSSCLALHLRSQSCLLTVGEFNGFTQGMEPEDDLQGADSPAHGRVQEIRMDMLRVLLRAHFLRDRLEETGLEKEVVEAAGSEEKGIWDEAAREIGDKRLRDLYARYRHLFSAREHRTYDVLASTDSAWVDSLARLATAPRPRAGGDSTPASGHNALSDTLPWMTVADTLLPRPLAMAGKKLRKRKCSGPLAWEGGFAILRPAEIRRLPALSYEEAIPALIGLSTMVYPDSVQALDEALQYYRAHPKEFAYPDTLDLDIALVPGRDSTSSRRPARRRLSALRLPRDIGDWLAARDSLAPGRSYGPAAIGLGTWDFRILSLKPGRGSVPFEQARDSLLAQLRRKAEAKLLQQIAAALQDKRRDRGMRLFEQILDKRAAPTPAEIAEAIAQDTSTASILPPDAPRERRQAALELMAETRLLEKRRHQDFATWLATAVELEGI